jgi:hypothetical protein
MAKPLLTFALSDDGNSMFVYEGGELVDGSAELLACHGVQSPADALAIEGHLQDLMDTLVGAPCSTGTTRG